MRTAYLECEIGPGQFREEVGVETKDINGNIITGFFPRSLIKEGKLKVIIYQEQDDGALIEVNAGDNGGYGWLFGVSRVWISKDNLSD